MSESTEVTVKQDSSLKQQTFQGVIQFLSESLGIKQDHMLNTIKAQCFKSVTPDKVTNEMLAAFMSVAAELRKQCPRFNPLLPGMLYAYPLKNGGIEPMVGPDGVFCLLFRPDIVGYEVQLNFENSNLVSATATIEVLDKKPFKKTCYLDEWQIDSNSNWKSRKCHMLELRTLKQCARYVIHGIPLDEEEREIMNRPVIATRQSAAERLAADLPPSLLLMENPLPVKNRPAEAMQLNLEVEEENTEQVTDN